MENRLFTGTYALGARPELAVETATPGWRLRSALRTRGGAPGHLPLGLTGHLTGHLADLGWETQEERRDGQDHRNRPWHHQLRRGGDGGEGAGRHRQRGGCAD